MWWMTQIRWPAGPGGRIVKTSILELTRSMGRGVSYMYILFMGHNPILELDPGTTNLWLYVVKGVKLRIVSVNPELLSATIPRRGCQTNDCWAGQETREVHCLRSNPASWWNTHVSHTCQKKITLWYRKEKMKRQWMREKEKFLFSYECSPSDKNRYNSPPMWVVTIIKLCQNCL